MAALRLGFAGTPDFAARHLAALIDSQHEIAVVLTQPDRPAGRGKKSRPGPVSSLALEHDLQLMQPQSLRDPASQEILAARELDALIVVAYGLLLPQAVLDIPRYGCLNVHGSLLPRWRGAAPIQRAIEAGDHETGVTIMQMDAGLDTGPMLATRRCPIHAGTTSADLYEALALQGPEALLAVLDDLPAAIGSAQSQSDAEANYARKIDKEEARLDWRRSAKELDRQIRAFNPAPGCFSELNGERIKIWLAQPSDTVSTGEPGVITAIDGGQLTVACGEGSLLVQRLQLPGARALSSEEVLRGHSERFSPGQRFSLDRDNVTAS